MFCDSRDRGTDGITGLAQIVHERFEFRDNLRIGGKKRVGTHSTPHLERNLDWSKPAQIPANDDVVLFRKPLSRNGRSRDTHRRFSGGGSPAASMVADAIFLPIGIVRVAGTECVDQIAIISTARIFVPNEQSNGCSSRFPFKDTG